MPTPYTPNVTGLDVDDAWTLDEPIDADAGNAATFSSPFEELANRVKQLEAKAGILGKARSWTAIQTFSAGIALASLTLSGAIAAASAAISGALTAGSAAIAGAITGASLNVGGGAITGGAITGSGNASLGQVALTNANPAHGTGFTNTLTKANVVKAWAEVELSFAGGGTITVNRAFNFSMTATKVGSSIQLAYVNPMLETFNCVLVTGNNYDLILTVGTNNTTHVGIIGGDRAAGGAWDINGGDTCVFYVAVLGLQ